MELKNIIKEEIQSFNEKRPIFRFVGKAENAPGFYNFQAYSNDYDVDITESDIVVTWRVGFWLNDYGIENFMIDVESVQGTYHVELYDKQTDELSQENDRDIAEIPWKFRVDNGTLNKGGALYIVDVDFDFKTKICDVSFEPRTVE